MAKNTKRAILYRIVMTDQMCPHGLKSKALLERKGFMVEDNHLNTRVEIDAFRTKYGLDATPQVFINGERIGGFDDLLVYFGNATTQKNSTTYIPVVALFMVAALMASVISWLLIENIFSVRSIEWFISISMVLLGLQKLQDVERFATMFLNYDLLAQRWVRYGYVYPFVETGAGLLMMAGVLTWLSAPAALFVASIGAISVFKAVYIDKRELKCACVGGESNVPLGFVSLIENLMMIGMAVWMLSKL